MFNAEIYRAIAPVDGNEAYAINYRNDPLVPFVIDYIREVQEDVYLGIVTMRASKYKTPLMYFLLQK